MLARALDEKLIEVCYPELGSLYMAVGAIDNLILVTNANPSNLYRYLALPRSVTVTSKPLASSRPLKELHDTKTDFLQLPETPARKKPSAFALSRACQMQITSYS
jgi:hypothetical protein